MARKANTTNTEIEERLAGVAKCGIDSAAVTPRPKQVLKNYDLGFAQPQVHNGRGTGKPLTVCRLKPTDL